MKDRSPIANRCDSNCPLPMTSSVRSHWLAGLIEEGEGDAEFALIS